MRYIDSKSKRGYVNLFADYILKKFDSETIIEVSDCGPFFVVKGETPIKEIVDLGPIKEQFLKDYPNANIKTFNVIDLITYNTETKLNPTWFKYHYTERPIYSQNVIDGQDRTFGYEQTIITSEFPHGYGLDMGRFEFYFGEYVSNHIFNITNANSIEIRHTKDEFIENFKLMLSLDKSLLSEDYVFELLLDVFYTEENIKEIREIINSYDILDDLLNPAESKPWLIKNKIEDIVVF